jgi:hypothetical protein
MVLAAPAGASEEADGNIPPEEAVKRSPFARAQNLARVRVVVT